MLELPPLTPSQHRRKIVVMVLQRSEAPLRTSPPLPLELTTIVVVIKRFGVGMSVRRLTLAALFTVGVSAVAACGSYAATSSGAASAPASAATAPVPVVASTDVYGAIATAVGGNALQVTSIINSPDADPHEYESTPSDAVAVGKAKLLIYNGAGYDDFATKILAASGAKPATIDVAALSGLQSQVPAGEEFNEHVWYSFPTVKKVADAIAADLGRADPERAATFTANAQAFDTKIDGLTAKLDAVKAKHGGATVAVTEPVPVYMV